MSRGAGGREAQRERLLLLLLLLWCGLNEAETRTCMMCRLFSNMLDPGTSGNPFMTTRAGSPPAWQSMTFINSLLLICAEAQPTHVQKPLKHQPNATQRNTPMDRNESLHTQWGGYLMMGWKRSSPVSAEH